MSETAPALPTAGLIRRLMAMVYDSLLLLGVAFAYGVIVWALRKLAGQNTLEPLTGPAAFVELLFLWITLAGYYVLGWTRRGQTLGMKSWRLRLEPPDGGAVSAATAWLRTLLAPVSMAAAGVGYLWVLFDKERGCWHDRWTGTRVVVLPKERGKRSS